MTDEPDTLPPREISLHVTAAAEIGFYVQEAGHVVACFVSRAELADWLEARLLEVPGERQREEAERRAYESAHSNVEPMPRIARPRTEPGSRRWYSRGT